ncbi:osmotically inducible protein OsmC [Parapedobacter pyrenivorans]|uniref:Osmotically inducible protein OsmC n=1 Tax=Parapedobacter pyrenivorans TaxID=1305674 RepID=A0A917HX81_9SPHI|nr:OsmC family protein [Parapedobacter pyrenivorans]GGG93398.1 osmotically inducible protein OsmC [Parapedobacter pyrenivorans]
MKFSRKASAHWQGTGKDGSGTVSTQSNVLDKTQYSYKTRFEDGVGTNPEELIGAAHAGCFTMQLSFLLSEKGYEPTDLHTDAKVTFEDGSITSVQLDLKGTVPGISESEFKEIAGKAKEICPISKLLDTTIELAVSLEGQ